MNCHTAILPNSAKLAPVRESYVGGMPIPVGQSSRHRRLCLF